MDFAIYKNTPVRKISEAFSVQLRAEIFNLTNHYNFVPPQPGSGDSNSQLFGADGSPTGLGQISALATDPREMQFAIKVIW